MPRNNSNEPEWGYQNITINEGRDDGFYGNLQLTPEFLEELLDRIDNNEIELNETGHFTLYVNLYPREVRKSRSIFWSGNVVIPEPRDEEDEPPARRRRSRR